MLRRRLIGSVADKDYIEFADAGIGAYFAQRYGDGVGITYKQAAAISEFDKNLVIANIMSGSTCTFDELNYFTGIVSLPAHFCNSTNITINCLAMPNLVTIGYQGFWYCNITEVNCPKLIIAYLNFGQEVQRVIMGNDYIINGNMDFNWMTSMEYLYIPNLQTVNANLLVSCTNPNLKVYLATPKVIAIDSSVTENDKKYIFNGIASTAKLYVPSNLVAAYKAAGMPWSTFSEILAI